MMASDASKEEIIKIFRERVKGNIPSLDNKNSKFAGKEGHWLEEQFGISHNASNSPDIHGFELKNMTRSKTTFGDWSANEYIFNNKSYSHIFISRKTIENKRIFLKMFGKPNQQKNGRYSWSGEPCPTISCFNDFGQKLIMKDNFDIVAIYDFSRDLRTNKDEIIPDDFKTQTIELARWYGIILPDGAKKRATTLKSKFENKFNDKGWFTCKKDETGAYCAICFGNPMSFENWIQSVKDGIVFFDSGMYEGNARLYAMWRANNQYWDSLITDKYE